MIFIDRLKSILGIGRQEAQIEESIRRVSERWREVLKEAAETNRKTAASLDALVKEMQGNKTDDDGNT